MTWAKRHSRLVVLVAMLAGVGVVIALCGAGSVSSPYRVGSLHTQRGRVIALPLGTSVTFRASWDNTARKCLVEACGLDVDRLKAFSSYGVWLLDADTGQYRLIHDCFNGETASGFSLRRLTQASLSPDGRTIVGLWMQFSPDAKSITVEEYKTAEQRWMACLESALWVSIDMATGARMTLKDLTAQWRSERTPWTPSRPVWVDSERVAFMRDVPTRDAPPESNVIYTIRVRTGQVEELIREPLGTYVGYLRRVGDGRILYCLDSPSPELAEYMRTATQPDFHRFDEAAVLKLADLTGPVPLTRVLPISRDQADLREGALSPDGRYYAFEKKDLAKGTFGLAILNVTNGKIGLLPQEVVVLRQWHPDGTKLLGAMDADCPQDPPGVLVEIPVEDVLATLE